MRSSSDRRGHGDRRGTALFYDPLICPRINSGLLNISRNDYANVASSWARSETSMNVSEELERLQSCASAVP